MSKYTRGRQRHETVSAKTMFHQTEQELMEGYLEVEITGLTLRRLAVAYAVLLRGAWSYTLDNVRSLLRPTPAL